MFEDKGGCCGARDIKVRQIEIDGREVGIAGILELFKSYYKNGRSPENIQEDELFEDLSKNNHIPENKEEAYKEAFMREYEKYYKDRENERPPSLLRR